MDKYWTKFYEATYNLQAVKVAFAKKDRSFEYCMNNFLSSTQSVFWILNKSFSVKKGYDEWKNDRTNRLPLVAKTFKDLRNISLKEEPIKHEGIINDFDFGAVGIVIPAHATVTCPWIDTHTGMLMSNKATIKTIEGKIYEVEPLIIHDFLVEVLSDNKKYKIESFLKEASEYLEAIKNEIKETEIRYKN